MESTLDSYNPQKVFSYFAVLAQISEGLHERAIPGSPEELKELLMELSGKVDRALRLEKEMINELKLENIDIGTFVQVKDSQAQTERKLQLLNLLNKIDTLQFSLSERAQTGNYDEVSIGLLSKRLEDLKETLQRSLNKK